MTEPWLLAAPQAARHGNSPSPVGGILVHFIPPKRSSASCGVLRLLFAFAATLRCRELGSAHWYAHRSFNHPLLRLLIHCTALLRHGCQRADSRCSYRSTKVSRYQQLSGRQHPPPPGLLRRPAGRDQGASHRHRHLSFSAEVPSRAPRDSASGTRALLNESRAARSLACVLCISV